MAGKIFELEGRITVDANDAKDKIDDVTSHAEKRQASFGKTLASVGGALVTTVVALGTAMYNVAEETREYRTQMGQLETAFIAQGHSAEAAEKTYRSLVRTLGDTGKATEAAQHIAKLAENEQEMSEWTTICTGVFATFGESLPVESLTEACNETAKTGETTGALADALNWAGVKESDFERKLRRCKNEEQRAKLIRDTLTESYGEAAAQYEETNKKVLEANEANENMRESMAALGDAAEPAITTVKNIIADMCNAVVPLIEGVSAVVVSLGEQWVALKETMQPISTSINVGINYLTQTGQKFIEDPAGTVEKAVEGGEVLQNKMWESVSNWWNGTVKPALGLASGLDFVPRDDLVARLHYGEAVLTRKEAEAWRSGDQGTKELAAAMQQMVAALPGMMADAMRGVKVEVHNREFARLVKAVT